MTALPVAKSFETCMGLTINANPFPYMVPNMFAMLTQSWWYILLMSKSGFSCICNPLPLSSFWWFFFMLLCFSLLSVWMCVIIMSWSQAIWVGWLVCISGVNCYTYSWPGSKLAWIFILSSGCRRVEWVWFQSAEKKLTQPFVWWTRTLDDCHGPVGMPGERRVYAGYCIYLSHVAAIGKQCLW